jgi:hypothetical protein
MTPEQIAAAIIENARHGSSSGMTAINTHLLGQLIADAIRVERMKMIEAIERDKRRGL